MGAESPSWPSGLWDERWWVQGSRLSWWFWDRVVGQKLMWQRRWARWRWSGCLRLRLEKSRLQLRLSRRDKPMVLPRRVLSGPDSTSGRWRHEWGQQWQPLTEMRRCL